MKRAALPCRIAAGGFSLIELLVSMAIGLIVTLAITTVMVRTGGDRRTSASVNDINQTGTYVSYVLDRAVRNAGSGFAQSWTDAFGCRINAAKSNTAILPRPTAFPASSPFASVSQTARLAPVLIGKGLADTGAQTRGDVLTVMGGTAGFGELPLDVKTSSVTNTDMRLPNTLTYNANDLVLLADPAVTGGCIVEQVASRAGDTLTFGGTYYKTAGTNVALSAFGATTVAVQLGNASNNPPQMQLYGVGDNSTLFSYDLLQIDGTDASVPIANGVVEMRAVYGVDTTTPPDGTLDTWIDPVSGSGYTVADLSCDQSLVTCNSRALLRSIVAVRVGLILRTSLQERDPVVPSGATETLFSDIGLTQTRTLSTAERNFRFRTIEFTVPLRNLLYAPAS
jgi:type IV pilus assembly protein PilW